LVYDGSDDGDSDIDLQVRNKLPRANLNQTEQKLLNTSSLSRGSSNKAGAAKNNKPMSPLGFLKATPSTASVSDLKPRQKRAH
jgi:hypothetical protein